MSSSEVFNNLQFSGSEFRAINQIPPFEFHPEEVTNEMTVILTNNQRYCIEVGDLEKITCMVAGTYSIWEAGNNGRRLDMEIIEYDVNAEFFRGMALTDAVIQKVNTRLTMPRRTATINKMFSRRNPEMGFLDEVWPTGRL